ncbi:MAG TPA: ACP S-malonyltransferase [Micromonosporaceae bacterium]
MTTAWLFPGQGAQRRGMGASVLDRYPDLVAQADEALGYSVREQCLTGAEPGLQDTRYVQPALFVVCALSALARLEEGGRPDVLAGHSLGEYTALFVAGCFDFATGVRLVRRRGELMSAASGGGMTAVVGLRTDTLEELLAGSGIDDLDLANRNSDEQIVLSGPVESLARAGQLVAAAGGRAVPLRVSAPFHSRYMAQAAEQFRQFLTGEPLVDPTIPVISNVTARPYPAGSVAELLVRQIHQPVRWWESMSLLVRQGVGEVVEVGPGRVLTPLWEAARARPCQVPSQAASADPAPTAPMPGPAPSADSAGRVRAEQLGSAGFRRDYGIRYAYLAGAMYKGIASAELVIRLGQAGLMGFFGAGGCTIDEIEAALRTIRSAPGVDGRFGMNLLASPDAPGVEREIVDLYLRHDVRFIEAASYTGVTPGVVHFRFRGAHRDSEGRPRALRHVLAKVSRPEVAEAFMSPPPAAILAQLVAEGALTEQEAAIAAELPVAGDICVEADSGGHTDSGNPYTLIPAMLRLRDEVAARHGVTGLIRVGAAGGIGSPEAVAAAFSLGADFVLTGSVNQCSPQAGTSDAVKELLARIDVPDTAYAPAGDLFELGARVQVVRKGTLFAARANKLHQLYRQLDSLDDIDPSTRETIEQRYFRATFDEVWEETREYLRKNRSQDIERAERNPKVKMALVFRWYFAHSTRLALDGVSAERVNFQIHCGPAMGTFNRCVAGTPLQDWRARHVDAIAELLMTGAAAHLDRMVRVLTSCSSPDPQGGHRVYRD